MEIKTVSGKKLTTIGIGGECKVYYPENIDELVSILKNEEQFSFIGGGSNVVICDNPEIPFISLRKFRKFLISKGSVTVGAGVLLKEIISFQIRNKLSFLEFLAGIPSATVGGLVAQNAGAFGREMKDLLRKVVYLSFEDFSLKELSDFSEFSYRESPFPHKGLVLEATFKVSKRHDIKNVISTFVRNRLLKHPSFTLKTAGSTFKNPDGFSAGYLIDKAGLKGFSVGDLKISEKHGNFLINTGDGTFSDFCKIVDTVKDKVFKLFNVELELEVKILGL